MPTADDVDLSHLKENDAKRFREMLKKHDSMWTGHLGEINTTKHHIRLFDGAQPVTLPPHRAGMAARKFIEAEVKRMIDAKVCEPSQSEWASTLVLEPKPDGSYRFYVDY